MIRAQLVKYIFAIHSSTRTWMHETYGHASIVKLRETVKHRVDCNSEHFKISVITLPQIKLSNHIPPIAATMPQMIDIHNLHFRRDLILEHNWLIHSFNPILKWCVKAVTPWTTQQFIARLPRNNNNLSFKSFASYFFSPENVCKHIKKQSSISYFFVFFSRQLRLYWIFRVIPLEYIVWKTIF